MSEDVMIALMITETKGKIDNNQSIEERLKTAMKSTFNHWMCLDEQKQFDAAVASVFMTASDEEKGRLKNEIESIKILSAIIDGIPVDFEKFSKLENPIGIIKLWQEIKGEQR